MGLSDKKQHPQKLLTRPYKQCPDCLERLPLDAKRCKNCGQKVGKVQADGKAQKPIDWKAYLLSALFIILFLLYINWAFF